MADERPARILIVDDEEALVTALSNTLRDQGYETTGFASSNEALATLQKQSFDLLLADLMMPEMDGITLLRAATDIDPYLIGIIMTGQGTIDTAVEAMKAGAFDYILKPFKMSTMRPVLVRALEMQRLRVENAALDRRVRQRTAELEATNKELEAFAYSVSHDLRAPLRAIEGFSDLLLKKFFPQVPPEAQRLLQVVGTNAERMSQLIDALLDLSRLGRQPLTKQPVKLTVLVQDVWDELRKQQDDRDIEFRLHDLPDCVGDIFLLRQVFVNLLSNALKYTRRKDKAVVEVGSQRRDDETIYYVQDNGAGFDMGRAEKLFGVFQRLHRAEEFEGTGIGLSIVQRIIHRHQGRIWADATPGERATFYFILGEE